MKFSNQDLGFRETIRLIKFMQKVIEEHPTDCIGACFSYDIYYDEPCIIQEDTTYYASDYDYAFDAHNNIENI